MTIQDSGLPLHKDATFAIRPRIFLEGNFFVDISPGTPKAPVVGAGHTFPIQQGVEPVQLDQVLTGLQSNTRHNLQILLQQYGKAVKVGGPGFNRSIQYWLPAYEYSAIVAHDFLGTQPHDLSRYIAAQGDRGRGARTPTRNNSRAWSPTSTRRPTRSPASSPRCARRSSSCRARCPRRSRPSTPSTPPSRRCASSPWR